MTRVVNFLLYLKKRLDKTKQDLSKLQFLSEFQVKLSVVRIPTVSTVPNKEYFPHFFEQIFYLM